MTVRRRQRECGVGDLAAPVTGTTPGHTVVAPVSTAAGGLVGPVDGDVEVAVGPTGTVSAGPAADTGTTTVATAGATVPVDGRTQVGSGPPEPATHERVEYPHLLLPKTRWAVPSLYIRASSRI